MSGETESQESGWTTDTLHAHMAKLFEAVWREMNLVRDRMEHDFRLQDERMDRQQGEQERRTRIALNAHETALNVQRETSQREVGVAAQTSEKAVTAALDAQKEAVQVAQVAANQRADSMNEWRRSLDDVLTRSMPRPEAELAISRAGERLQDVITAQQHMITRQELDQVIQRDGERFRELTDRLTRAEAHAAGAKENRTGIYAAIGAVGVLITIVVVVANAFFSS